MLGILIHPLWQLLNAIVLSVFPLWWLVDRVPADSLTKLLLAVLGNFSFIYLLEFGAHLTGTPQWIPMSILLISSTCSAIRLYKHKSNFAWDGLISWAGLSMWILGLQSLIVAYGAASWYGDWYEHYERSIWFFAQQPPDQRFLFNLWSLAARGPLFNAVCGLFMCSGNDFASYQVYATVLNTLPCLPLALLIRDVAKLSRSSALIWSMLICGLAPFAVQQETYSWTKSFTSGFLLAAIYLYIAAFSQNKKMYAIFSFAAFAGAILAHYLSVLFVIFFVCHFLYTAVKQKWELKTIGYIAAVSFFLLSTWFGYVFAMFGFRGTLESTSTFGDYGKRQGTPEEPPPWPLVFAGNMVNTTIPYSWRHGWKNTWHGIGQAPRLVQRDSRTTAPPFIPSDSELDIRSEYLADLATNPNSLLGCLGFAGLIGLVIALLMDFMNRNSGHQKVPGTVFWLIFFVTGIPLNVFASRDYSAIGVAHLNLQPFIFLMAVYLVGRLRKVPRIAIFLTAVFVLESALITGAWISIQRRKLPISIQADGRPVVAGKLHADGKYIRNYIYKLYMHANYLSDVLGPLEIPFLLLNTTLGVSSAVLIRYNNSKLR